MLITTFVIEIKTFSLSWVDFIQIFIIRGRLRVMDVSSRVALTFL